MRGLKVLRFDKCHLGAGGDVHHGVMVDVLQRGLDAALEVPHGRTDRGPGRDVEPVVRETPRGVGGADDGGQEVDWEPGTGQQLRVPLLGDAVEVSKAGGILDRGDGGGEVQHHAHHEVHHSPAPATQ